MAKYIVQMRRGTATQWEDSDIIPLAGEIVVEIDDTNNLHKLKIGDGVHTYPELAYLMAGDEIVTQVLAKAMPRVVTVDLTSDWVEAADATYSQVVAIDGITEHSRLDLQPNADMMAEFKQLGIALVTENDGGVITVYSVGNVPLKAYTMQATIVETDCSVEDPIVGIPVGAPSAGESGGSITLDQEVPWYYPDGASETSAPSTKATASAIYEPLSAIMDELLGVGGQIDVRVQSATDDLNKNVLVPNVLRHTTVESNKHFRGTADGLDFVDGSLTTLKIMRSDGGTGQLGYDILDDTISIISIGRNLAPSAGSYTAPEGYTDLGGTGMFPWSHDDYMPCIPGETYSVSSNDNCYAEFVFYDRSKTPLSLIGANEIVEPSIHQTVTAPADAYWMKVCFETNDRYVDMTDLMINRGAEALQYEERVEDVLYQDSWVVLDEGGYIDFETEEMVGVSEGPGSFPYVTNTYRVWNGGTEVFYTLSDNITIVQDYYTKAPESATADAMEKLTIDDKPTEGSTNPVSSGGMHEVMYDLYRYVDESHAGAIEEAAPDIVAQANDYTEVAIHDQRLGFDAETNTLSLYRETEGSPYAEVVIPAGGSITLDQEIKGDGTDSETNAPSTKAVATAIRNFGEDVEVALVAFDEHFDQKAQKNLDDLHRELLVPNVLRNTTIESNNHIRGTADGLDIVDGSLTALKTMRSDGGDGYFGSESGETAIVTSYGRNLAFGRGINAVCVDGNLSGPSAFDGYYQAGGEFVYPWATEGYMPCIAGETYSLSSWNNYRTEFAFYSKNKGLLSVIEADVKVIGSGSTVRMHRTITAPSNAYWMRAIFYGSSDLSKPFTPYLMINRGAEALPYEDHNEDSILVNCRATLADGGYINFENGEVVDGTVVSGGLDGGNTYRVWNGGTEVFYTLSDNITITQDYYTKTAESASLDYVNETMGDVESALDGILAIQTALIGG